MKTAILIHGMPSKEEYFNPVNKSPSNKQWLPWLQSKLVQLGILTQTPEMPNAYNPVYEKWEKVFKQFILDENTILVGHSCGGGFILRYLSENNIKVGKVFLIAPWLDPEKYLKTGMFDFELDSDLVNKTAGVTTIYSTDDDDYILDTIKILKEKVNGVEYIKFKDKGHFCSSDLGGEEFPELLDLINQ
jgi:predicted alpha/beta hydrolase family esterase